MRRTFLATILVGAAVVPSSSWAQSRGALLYSTHCAACHTVQMHWRDHRVARVWTSLKVEVRRWQAAASLAWGDDDIVEVARYLNETTYHFEIMPGARSQRGTDGQRRCAVTTGAVPPFNRRPT